MTLTITDETALGKLLQQIELEVEDEIISVEDLIRLRVENEVNRYNAECNGNYNGLVQPTDAERTLNGFKVKKGNAIDAEKQTYIALKAFNDNGYFILVDNRQVGKLHEEILIDKNTTVSFMRLTPLVGG
ncbi:MAG: hypothetical protein RLZZ292_2147 [Bacteroidota bacterium]|jgi:hypothetical protein